MQMQRSNSTPDTSKTRQRLVCVLLFQLVALQTSGCFSSTWVPIASVQDAPAPVESSHSLYMWPDKKPRIVAPGTLVKIASLDQKLNGTYTVDIDGTLKLPHNRTLRTEKLDARSLESKIRAMYQSYFKSPHDLRVSVTMKDALIDVQGLVIKPGQYVVREAASLDEIIAQAGGLQERDPAEKARYLRITGPYGSGVIPLGDYHSGGNSLRPCWHGGERLFFQTTAHGLGVGPASSSHVVRVIGQVKNPAEYTARADATFFSYLLQAGGPTDRADLAHITLIRSTGAEMRARTFNGHNFGEIPPIEPGDTILVNADVPSPTEKSTRVVASIASILTSLSMLALAGL